MAKRKKLTKKDLAAFREALESERAELTTQITELDAEADITRWRDGGFDDDPADTGSANIERERAQSLSNHARRLLLMIDDALERIEDGTYGVCQRCDDPIPKGRLEAIPYSEFCVACKQLEEHGR